MSLIIGYWTSKESSQDLQQLSAIAANLTDLKITHGPGYAVAINGKHSNLRRDQHPEKINASLSISGKDCSPDVWANISSEELLLGRAVFGRATLFWTQTDSTIWFSSQLRSLLKILEHPSISVNGFYAYGCFSYVPAPDTPVARIFAVPAAMEMSWTTVTSTPQSRSLHEWRESEEQIGDKHHAALSLRRLLEESASTQLESTSQKTIGVFLSGGLDSSLTAALLARNSAKVRAYTLDFSAEHYSEVAHAESVARWLQIPLTKVPVNAKTMRRSLRSTATSLDGLYGDGVTVPLAAMYERASQEVDLVFNGEGGDQLFGGWTNKPLIASAVYGSLETAGPMASEYMRTCHRFYGLEAATYSSLLLPNIDPAGPLRALRRALDPAYTKSLLHRLRRANLLLKGADNIQPRATNLGLAHNLEVRTLFCSRELADWTFSVSDELWLHQTCEKYLLKLAVLDLLPEEIVWREKRGMGVPLTLWLKGSLRRWCQRQLRPQLLAAEGLWEKNLQQRISDGELSGQVQGRRIGETLWLLLMWRAWREQVYDVAATACEEKRRSFRQISVPFVPRLKRA